MASDELRKKWGTVFMGEREAGMAELAAMQEPLIQERQKQQRRQDYLENVRARASERAREILAAAYTEREKILEETKREAEARCRELTRESEALRAGAQADRAGAAEDREMAAVIRKEAEDTRSDAHNNGFQAGMDQAGTELKEFRAELGASLSSLLRALEAQRAAITAFWREDIAELVRAAVTAGTGWVLKNEHEAVLRALLLNALDMLEDRAVVSLRVHPDDEAQVGEIFTAAHERAPELKQWVINTDASIERGGFTAESAHGSVEVRREYFRDMVRGVLENLVLPAGENGVDHAAMTGEAMHALVEREVAKITAMAPPLMPMSPGAAFMDVAPPATATETSPAIPPEDAFMDAGTPAPDFEDSSAIPPQNAHTDAFSEAEREAETPSVSQPQQEDLPAPLTDDAPNPETAQKASPGTDGGKTQPSIAELENELFPEDEFTPPETSAVFAEGGFLPGKENA